MTDDEETFWRGDADLLRDLDRCTSIAGTHNLMFAAAKRIRQLRTALEEAASSLENCRYSEQPLARKLRTILGDQVT